ncbi:MerC family mercury resistance protein [Arhodomonas sp. AD133]|uniref:MerC family mercury resistance protein n=1 Tax=Arhodomonas sp. AD133 TaxID=3415009 RepID=UPI003EC045D3
MVAILGYSREQILAAVQDMYTAVARRPDVPFHFPVGRSAASVLGYSSEQLDSLPPSLLESFAGVGYPFRAGAVRPGDTCVDIGAGAGVDTLIAAQQAGPSGQVIAVDVTPAMSRKLQRTASEAGIDNVAAVEASAESLPLVDACVDSITSNGAFNLIPDKRRAVTEAFRVLRPGGRLQIADVVIGRPVTVDCHSDPRLWVECVVGATIEERFLALFRDAGFEDIRVLRRFDYFAHSPSRQTREIAASFDARAVEVVMRRGKRKPTWLWQWLRRLDPRRMAVSLWRRGLAGVAVLGLAVLSCYGVVATMGLLALLGISMALNEIIWAGTIAVFTVLATLCIAAGARRHRSLGPLALAVAGAAGVLYTQVVSYQVLVELAGFLLLGGAVAWDVWLRRRWQARVLGLE